MLSVPFKKIVKKNRKHKRAAEMVLLISEVFKIRRPFRDSFDAGLITEEEFLEERKAVSYPAIMKVIGTCRERRRTTSDGDELAKAYDYILNRWERRFVYLECTECSPANNVADLQARDVAVGRGNWLFFNTRDGANIGAVYYSLVQTAKANGLDSRKYLKLVLSSASYMHTDEEFETLLPWNVDLGIIDVLDEERRHAKPDPGRQPPYFLTGLSD